MIELLERQKKLTANQWKLICTANLADLLDFFDLTIRQGREVRVVESQTIRRNQGAGLFHVRSECLAQRCMQDVRPCMISRNPAPPVFIDLRLDFIVHAELSEFDRRLVNQNATNRRVGIEHSRHAVR